MPSLCQGGRQDRPRHASGLRAPSSTQPPRLPWHPLGFELLDVLGTLDVTARFGWETCIVPFPFLHITPVAPHQLIRARYGTDSSPLAHRVKPQAVFSLNPHCSSHEIARDADSSSIPVHHNMYAPPPIFARPPFSLFRALPSSVCKIVNDQFVEMTSNSILSEAKFVVENR